MGSLILVRISFTGSTSMIKSTKRQGFPSSWDQLLIVVLDTLINLGLSFFHL